jgi:ribose transport system substrate-binding protein
MLALVGQGAEGASSPNKKVIAISFPNGTTQDAVIYELNVARAEAKRRGYKLIIDDPRNDLNKQLNTINTWVAQRVGTIISVVLQPGVFNSIVKKARAAGIKWVSNGLDVPGQNAAVRFQHYAGAYMLGTEAAKWIARRPGGTAKVALLTFSRGVWAQQRAKGFKDALKKYAPNAKIVAEQDALSTAEGLSVTSTILQAHPDLNVVLNIVQTGSDGAYQAFLQAGHEATDPNVFIGGMDGSKQALQLIAKGDTMYRASAALDNALAGRALVGIPMCLWEGKRITGITKKCDSNGKFELVTPGRTALLKKYLKQLSG